MNIRVMFAIEAAEQIGAVVLAQLCDRNIGNGAVCGFPLLVRPGQDLPFCWFCTTDRRCAMEGRTQLLRATLAEKGIEIPNDRIWRSVEDNKENENAQGCLSFGMPL